jgi:hypothetical protein
VLGQEPRESDYRACRRPVTCTDSRIPQSANDLYLVADVQGVVEGLRGGLGEVHATVGADCDAALVEGVAAVEEHRVGHRRVVEFAAAVVEIFPSHEKVPGAVGALALPVATGTGP